MCGSRGIGGKRSGATFRARPVCSWRSDRSDPIDPIRVTFGPPGPVRASDATRRWRSRPDRTQVLETGASWPRVSTNARELTGTDAIAVVTKFAEEELGAEVTRVDHLNLGWDLELRIGDQQLLVEVEGHAGSSSSFILTRNELRAARSGPAFRLAIVTGLEVGEGVIALITDASDLRDDDRLTPVSWQVDDLPHTAYPWWSPR
jgi:Domain of unknown function (DUF3883)